MRGILMIEPLYHQVVAGNKTQTRRAGGLQEVNHKPDLWFNIGLDKEKAIFLFNQSKQRNPAHQIIETCKSRYRIGEVLFIKEPTAKAKIINEKQIYAYLYGCNGNKAMISEFKWENKLFMPADRARAFIRITGIRCERLMDISDQDCVAEGIERDNVFGQSGDWKNYLYPQTGKFVNGADGKVIFKQTEKKATFRLTSSCKTPKDSFLSLYKFANKVKEVPNLWVWVYEFEYLKGYKP
jgi:hypothetical protein